MSELRELGQLTGRISNISMLKGTLSCEGSIHASLSEIKYPEQYAGDYEVVPKAFGASTLNTANKVMSSDIKVLEIPYFETSNDFDGTTIYIAKEI